MHQPTLNKLHGMFVGLAVGDALGMPLEFKQTGSFVKVTGLRGGGPFNLPLGYWTDDTSMALCLADSIIAKQGYDSFDVMARYMRWKDEGYRSSTGKCFDIGNQVSAAIDSFRKNPIVNRSEPRREAAGNGSIMRLAPVVMASFAAGNDLNTTMKLSSVSARETHYSKVAEESTALFGIMLHIAINASTKDDVFKMETGGDLLAKLWNAQNLSISDLKPTGFVIDTLEVASWAFLTSENYKDGALKAVNLGGDSDTTGAVYGQLAGAYYGLDGIPEDWLLQLYKHDEILRLANELSKMKRFKVLQTRFEEDVRN